MPVKKGILKLGINGPVKLLNLCNIWTNIVFPISVALETGACSNRGRAQWLMDNRRSLVLTSGHDLNTHVHIHSDISARGLVLILVVMK